MYLIHLTCFSRCLKSKIFAIGFEGLVLALRHCVTCDFLQRPPTDHAGNVLHFTCPDMRSGDMQTFVGSCILQNAASASALISGSIFLALNHAIRGLGPCLVPNGLLNIRPTETTSSSISVFCCCVSLCVCLVSTLFTFILILSDPLQNQGCVGGTGGIGPFMKWLTNSRCPKQFVGSRSYLMNAYNHVSNSVVFRPRIDMTLTTDLFKRHLWQSAPMTIIITTARR